MKTTKVGVIGTGMIGPLHIEALKRIPGLDPVVLVGSSVDKARKKAEALGVPTGLGDYKELLKMDEIESVHVCTPNHLHYPMVKAALEAGKHVICEKPLATTVQEAEELSELADKKGLVNAVHFNIRYYPLMTHLKRMVEAGDLGDVYQIQGSYLQDWLFYPTDYNWRLEPEYAGESRAVADIGSHWMDLIEYVSGRRIVEVLADFKTFHPTRKKPNHSVETYSGKTLKAEDYTDFPVTTEDYATVLLGFDNGGRGVFTVSQVFAGRKNRLYFEIGGSKQAITWESERPNEVWIGNRDEPNRLMLKDPALAHPDSAAQMGWPGGHNEGFPDTPKQMFRQIYARIRGEDAGGAPPYPTFADGLRELVLCERIVESSKKRAWVRV
ncbi:MAG: Gfo/Idh/MocA family protein [Spirochaetota bacterium]